MDYETDFQRFLGANLMAAATGLGGDTPSTGGFTIADEHLDAIWQSMANEGTFLSQLTHVPIGRAASVSRPAIDERSRANGSRLGGLSLSWVNEGEQISASKPQLRAIKLQPKKLAGIVWATTELADDAPAFAQWLEAALGREGSFVIEDALINGDGSGKPLGLLNSGALISVAAESGQAGGTVVAGNVANMSARLWPGSEQHAVWLASPELKPQLEQLSAGNGRLLTPPVAPGELPMLGLYPLHFHEACSAAGAVGDLILLDPGEIVIAEKSRQVIQSMHVKFLQDETAFRFTLRVDGGPAWNTAVTPFKGNAANTLSPYIAIQTRS